MANVSPGSSAIPLLTLCEPGQSLKVGVSKPLGASVGVCRATSAMPIEITPSGTNKDAIFCINEFPMTDGPPSFANRLAGHLHRLRLPQCRQYSFTILL